MSSSRSKLQLTQLYDGQPFLTLPATIQRAIYRGEISSNAARLLMWWSDVAIYQRRTIEGLFSTREAAQATGMDPAQVKRSRQELIDQGLLLVVARAARGQYVVRLNVNWPSADRCENHTDASPNTSNPCEIHTDDQCENHPDQISESYEGQAFHAVPQEEDHRADKNINRSIRLDLSTVKSPDQQSSATPIDLARIRRAIELADKFQREACNRCGLHFTSLFDDDTERSYLMQTFTTSMWTVNDYPPVAPEIFEAALRVAVRTYNPSQRHNAHIWRIARGICRNWYDEITAYRSADLDRLLSHLSEQGIAHWPRHLFDLAYAAPTNASREADESGEEVSSAAHRALPIEDSAEDADGTLQPDLPEPFDRIREHLSPLLRGVLAESCEIVVVDKEDLRITCRNPLLGHLLRKHFATLQQLCREHLGLEPHLILSSAESTTHRMSR